MDFYKGPSPIISQLIQVYRFIVAMMQQLINKLSVKILDLLSKQATDTSFLARLIIKTLLPIQFLHLEI